MHAQQGRRLPARSRIVIAGFAVLALAGCDGAVTELGAQSAGLLHERVAAVRAAADTENRDAAVAAVEAFRAEVQRLLDAGELTETEAAGLLAHADAIANGVLAEVVVPTPTPTPTPTATPTPDPTPVPVPTMTAEQAQMLQQETAERLSEMLRERLTEYVEKRIAEREAQEKAEKQAERKKDRRKSGDGKGSGGSDEN